MDQGRERFGKQIERACGFDREGLVMNASDDVRGRPIEFEAGIEAAFDFVRSQPGDRGERLLEPGIGRLLVRFAECGRPEVGDGFVSERGVRGAVVDLGGSHPGRTREQTRPEPRSDTDRGFAAIGPPIVAFFGSEIWKQETVALAHR